MAKRDADAPIQTLLLAASAKSTTPDARIHVTHTRNIAIAPMHRYRSTAKGIVQNVSAVWVASTKIVFTAW
jgi:hypothetical protein